MWHKPTQPNQEFRESDKEHALSLFKHSEILMRCLPEGSVTLDNMHYLALIYAKNPSKYIDLLDYLECKYENTKEKIPLTTFINDAKAFVAGYTPSHHSKPTQ